MTFTAAPAAAGTPFASTVAGAITLVLLAALCSVVGGYWLATRGRRRTQDETLILLRAAISPEGRPGLVQRMEVVESNLSVVAREVETHQQLTTSQRAEFLRALEELRTSLHAELAELRRAA